MGKRKKSKVHFHSTKSMHEYILQVLKYLRKSNQLTQVELSVKLGRNQDTVRKIENRLFIPSLNVLRDYGIVFDMTVSDILKLAEEFSQRVQQ